MTKLTITLLSTVALSTSAFAQLPSYMQTYSQPENNTSGSGGTVLGNLLPNEITMLEFNSICSISAEKWMPRTCTHVMAGDDDANGMYWNPGILGGIDALMSTANWSTPIGGDTQRSIYYSPAVAMGTNISGGPGLRPGDVGRINRVGFVDGQIEYFITQEQFNNALGLPPAYPINIDAVAFQPNYGVYFSVDADVPAMTVCGPTLIRDGDILCIPGSSIGLGAGPSVVWTAPASAVRVYTESQMDVMTANAMVADRFGACVTAVGDIESLEMDLFGPTTTIIPCPGMVLSVPTLIYSCENGTGASLLETSGGGSIHNTPCGPAGTWCGTGNPTMGPQMGVRPASLTVGAASYVNALADTRGCRHVLEPQQHVVSGPAPMGATMIDYYSPFVLSLILVELAPPTVPSSFPAFPFSPNCFPDLYTPSIIPWVPVGPGYGSFPMLGIPAAFTGKVLFQSVGFSTGTFELSTPAVIDII
ncbi:MAG: hypothetical protein ACI8UD_001656 [Planctomycetota bacterium]|jgi:hypothetical protein